MLYAQPRDWVGLPNCNSIVFFSFQFSNFDHLDHHAAFSFPLKEKEQSDHADQMAVYFQ